MIPIPSSDWSMLYRDAHMTGWAYKIIQESDMKFPMVFGEGKRSR